MNKAEFKIGDKVTFKPYEKATDGIVKSIEVGGIFKQQDDDRIFYKLGGNCDVTTTGQSIVESKLFGQREFEINFKGRKNGAIGITYKITDYRVALTPEKAIEALYDEYEHISQARAVQS